MPGFLQYNCSLFLFLISPETDLKADFTVIFEIRIYITLFINLKLIY